MLGFSEGFPPGALIMPWASVPGGFPAKFYQAYWPEKTLSLLKVLPLNKSLMVILEEILLSFTPPNLDWSDRYSDCWCGVILVGLVQCATPGHIFFGFIV